MASAVTESQITITIGERLGRNPALVSKVRRLDDTLVEIFGMDTPIAWDLVGGEPENCLSLHIGTPGRGECTRYPLESLLENTAWLKSVFVDMKSCLKRVQEYLRKLEALYQQIKTWVSRAATPYQVAEAPTAVEEAFTRKYVAKKCLIRFDKKEVEVRPRGVWWLTTDGRVDMVGKNEEYQLILSRQEGGWFWVEEAQTVALHRLTEEMFIRLVQDCMG